MIVVLDADTLAFDDAEWAPLKHCGKVIRHGNTPYDTKQIIENAKGAEIVLTNKVPLRREVIEALPDLRFIGVLATGHNVVDSEVARERGIPVSNVPAYSTASTAQHAVALLLELCNRVGEHNASVQAGGWIDSPVFSYWRQAPVQLEGLTVGLIGMGNIGRRVADTLHALGAGILAYSPSRRHAPEWAPFAWCSIPEIFEQADAVSLHCPQTPDNKEFVNGDLLACMKPGSFLVNTARGTLIHEHDLAQALREGPLGGAAIDVVQQEPMSPDCPLLGLPNCIVTPHMAWASLPARRRLLESTIANIEAFRRGQPQNVVHA